VLTFYTFIIVVFLPVFRHTIPSVINFIDKVKEIKITLEKLLEINTKGILRQSD